MDPASLTDKLMEHPKDNSSSKGVVDILSPTSATDRIDISKSLKSMDDISDSASLQRVYANNAPRILLETITSRTALLVIGLTYACFIIGFAIDLVSTYNSFKTSNKNMLSLPCNSQPPAGQAYGCSSDNYWNATVKSVQNIISIKLDVANTNVTNILENASFPYNLHYNIHIWACYEANGCGGSFASESNPDAHAWQKVYILDKVHVTITGTRDDGDTKSVSEALTPNTFQNQESIPMNGIIQSYLLSVEYLDDEYGLFTGPTSSSYVEYKFKLATRVKSTSEVAVTIVMLLLTVTGLAYYCWILSNINKHLLPEQKWIIIYLIMVILYQNPVYCVIVWTHSEASSAYASYVLDYMAQSGMFIVWLLFADSVSRKTKSRLFFYGGKLLLGTLIFVCGLCILTFQFPTLNADSDVNRSPVEAVVNWSQLAQVQFIVFSITYLSLLSLWALIWVVRLRYTGQRLKQLPYMTTRYIQLSYRFFTIQATLVTLYYVFQYGAVIYLLTRGVDSTDEYGTASIADTINILFRQQTQMFGKTLFVTVYAFIIAFLFLPANTFDKSTGILGTLASTYVITEEEQTQVTAHRKHAIRNIKRNPLNKLAMVNQVLDVKVHVFCVKTAILMSRLSYEAYYDPTPDLTFSGFQDKPLEIEKLGFVMVAYHYNKDHEVFCFIARETLSGRLAVVFRGTASKIQMDDNLNYALYPLNFYSWNTASLDHLDGLQIPVEYQQRVDDIEDVRLSESGVLNATFTHSHKEGNYSQQERPTHSQTQERPNHGDEEHDNSSSSLKMLSGGAQHVADATGHGLKRMMTTTQGLLIGAAKHTPVIKNTVQPGVHSGYYESYSYIRSFLHATLRKELVRNPTTVFCTGHSLGGALATIAALDIKLHTLPRVNAFLKYQSLLAEGTMNVNSIPSTDNILSGLEYVRSPSELELGPVSPCASVNDSFNHPTTTKVTVGEASKHRIFVVKADVSLYNFGSPRVGNHVFAQIFDREVRKSFRVVVDGDIVVGLPPARLLGYTHIGTEILIDKFGSGSIIVDPSFVERWLRTHAKSSIAVHSLIVYRKGLTGVELAAEFMKNNATEYLRMDNDPLRLGLNTKIADISSQKVREEELVSSLNAEIDSGSSENVQSIGDHMPPKESLLRQTAYADYEHQSLDVESDTPGESENKVAEHYAHDVQIMNTLLSQIKAQDVALRPAIPGAQWLRSNTIDRFGRGHSSPSVKSKNTTDEGSS